MPRASMDRENNTVGITHTRRLENISFSSYYHVQVNQFIML